jgi:hypothetical protein
MTVGWKLDRDQRARLLQQHPPRYARAVADHVTLKAGADAASEDAGLPAVPGAARLIGRADDGRGVEAMVVAINGSTRRPDGGTWHITWSLAEGREAKESNDVIAARGWAAFDGLEIALAPARW